TCHSIVTQLSRRRPTHSPLDHRGHPRRHRGSLCEYSRPPAPPKDVGGSFKSAHGIIGLPHPATQSPELLTRRFLESSCRRLVLSHCPTSSSHRTRLTGPDRKSTRLNSSHVSISYAVFCL